MTTATQSTTVNIGVIGMGGRVGGLVRKLLAHERGVRLAAVCDPSDAAVKNAAAWSDDRAVICNDPCELVTRDDIDWVWVGSPNHLHREHAVAALQAGKHVFCEKPLATTLDDCLAIRDAWRTSGCRFVLGFTLRFSPHYRRIRELLDEGVIGDPVSVEFNETLDWNHGGFIHRDWRRHRELAGTHLLEKCSHDFDLVNWFTASRVTRAASFGGLRLFTPEHEGEMRRIGPGPDGKPPFCAWPVPPGSAEHPFTEDKSIIDHQVAILEFASGVRATFHTNCAAGIRERRMLLLGTRGAIRADVIDGRIEYQRIGWDQPRRAVEPVASGDHGGGDEVLIDEMARCMLGGDEPAVGLQAGLESAVACFGVDEALDTGRVVDLTPLWRRVDDEGRSFADDPIAQRQQ
jgi:predicted dehydrogenase